MPVPVDIFAQVPPVPYDAARAEIRNGDIALFAGRQPMSQVIEHFTRSPFCHVGFIWRMDDINRVMLLESVEDAGVRMLPLSSKMNGGAVGKPYDGLLLVARHDDFPPPDGAEFSAKFRSMTEFAVDRLGCPYNAEEIGMIGVKIAASLANIPLPQKLQPGHAFICSEYADICYQKIGITISRASPDFIAPADFARDPKVQPVIAIQPN